MKTQMKCRDDEESYEAADGSTMKREDEHQRRWVLRDATGELIDVDGYRFDLADRHDIELLWSD